MNPTDMSSRGTALTAALAREREAAHQQYLREKQEIEQRVSRAERAAQSDMRQRFDTTIDTTASALVERTVGLRTRSDFEQTRRELEQQAIRAKQKKDAAPAAAKRRQQQAMKARLSFMGDDEEEEEEASEDDAGGGGGAGDGVGDSPGSAKRARLVAKNPEVETSFLPDAEREQRVRTEVERLKQEYLEEQERKKKEPLEVVYSYWDGRGHRSTVTVTRGSTIEQFLLAVTRDVHELRSINPDNLMFIKEDLIIPHHLTFHFFIEGRVRGKSGPLFHFDRVFDDVRLLADARIEKDESHAAKVVERSWYERNKHLHPADRWEVFDPTKRYERFTVR